ncbi:MAG: CRISPR-associated endonuclease Cas2 [Chloroflexi bacterium]|nr:CRISPR-associated endonuclease Cas2 [Chloroflexota bacterium]
MNPIILIYDIENDRVRTKVADACLDYGLDRIQFSAFAGHLSRNHREELMLRIENLLGDTKGNIRLIPIAIKDWDNRLEINHD